MDYAGTTHRTHGKQLNRLSTAQNLAVTSVSGQFSGMNGCWTYDGFGNRKLEAFSTATSTPCASGAPIGAPYTVTTPMVNNQVSGISYDVAGNVLNDNKNQYIYDAEGRLCAVAYPNGSGGNYYEQYFYDASEARVGKTAAASLSCGAPSSPPTTQYLLGLGGEQVTELSVSGTTTTPMHTNIFAGGKLLATYDLGNGGLHFALTDPLGSKRVQVSGAGVAELNCLSLPFGNNLGNTRTTDCVPVGNGGVDATEHHFTGKERDAESGNDYFGARYYGSSMGRFLSPDPVIITPERLTNPQQLNLYAYVANNPLRFIDPTGEILQCVGDAKSQSQCFSDLQQTAGDAASRLSMDAKTGVISFDTKDLDLSKNEGASLVNNLVGSKNTYDFSVGPTIMTDKGPVRVDHIGTDMANLPAFGDQRQIGNPPAGVRDILDIYFNNPNMTRVSNTNLQVAPEWTVAFHELAEAYEKIDGGKGGSYAAGHNAALQREMTLRDQRPYLKQYNTGAGGPANSPNPQGGIIIKK